MSPNSSLQASCDAITQVSKVSPCFKISLIFAAAAAAAVAPTAASSDISIVKELERTRVDDDDDDDDGVVVLELQELTHLVNEKSKCDIDALLRKNS